MNSILTVSAVNAYIAFKLKNDPKLKGIAVSGEISDITVNQTSGHMYFSITDGKSYIKAVMFSSNVARLRFTPYVGMSIIAFGGIDVYERSGVYQIVCTQIMPSGEGAERLALLKLRDELESQGVFSKPKRELPRYPKKIAVVTSQSGAAIHDIEAVAARRYPFACVTLFDALVQGASAPQSISDALAMADKSDADVIILTRGGGSVGDLSCFNTKTAVMAVYNCNKPVVCAVGHEIDYTLCDLAADFRAPTPSAAAELCTPDIKDIYSTVLSLRDNITSSATKRVDSFSSKVSGMTELLTAYSPVRRISSMSYEITLLKNSIASAAAARISSAENSVKGLNGIISSADPMLMASKGYALIYQNGEIVTRVTGLSGVIDIKMRDGSISARIINDE